MNRSSQLGALADFQYRGARALVILHERALREFFEVYSDFRRAGLPLPVTADPAYVSLPLLLRHVLGAARGYLSWTCKQLAWPPLDLEVPPPAEQFEPEAAVYLEAVLAEWRTRLAPITEHDCESTAYPSNWKIPYCIDAMLEHAVMHPIRHTFQLRELLGANPR